ncbi:hypothetical protein BGZ94_008165 [Podila epigama]|nr:hypothetical protein BGZ94_008165 [Podila epigama]
MNSSSVGQKKQKKKVTKMALSDFLSDPSTGSWADEMDDLPSAPAAVSQQDDYSRGGFGNDRGGRGFSGRGFNDREEPRFQPRAPVDLPTRPPYTIHLGNLPFDATETDIQGFFIASQITSIRIMKDFEDRPKGFGYVEFDSLDSLKKALEKNGQSLCGRNVRVSVAEPPREREVREDRTAGEWRREGPITPAPNSSNRFGNDRSGDRSGPRGDREFGSRFNNSERPPDRTETATSWRRETPLPAAAAEGGRSGWEKPREREHRDTSWGSGNNSFANRSAPAARKKLELKPRSAEAASSATSESKPAKASPFGAAKPVDSEEALRRAEEKLQQEKKEIAEKLRKEKDSKEFKRAEKKEDSAAKKEVAETKA